MLERRRVGIERAVVVLSVAKSGEDRAGELPLRERAGEARGPGVFGGRRRCGLAGKPLRASPRGATCHDDQELRNGGKQRQGLAASGALRLKTREKNTINNVFWPIWG